MLTRSTLWISGFCENHLLLTLAQRSLTVLWKVKEHEILSVKWKSTDTDGVPYFPNASQDVSEKTTGQGKRHKFNTNDYITGICFSFKINSPPNHFLDLWK